MNDVAQQDVPLFPLGTVLYPGGVLPLRIFEPRYIDMVSECMREDRAFGVVPIVSGREAGEPAEFHPAGTLARITSWDHGDDGLLHLVATGTQRFEVRDHTVREDGLVRAAIMLREQPQVRSSPQHDDLRELLRGVFAEHGEIAPPQPWQFDDDCWVTYRFAELLPLSASTCFELLHSDTPDDLLERFRELINGNGENGTEPPPGTH